MTKTNNIKLIQTNQELISFEHEWKQLEKDINHQNLTSSFDWLSTWWNIFKDVNNTTIGYNKELIIICLFENDKLTAIAPFLKVFRKKYGLKISFIEFLGQQWAGNYLDIICAKGNTNYKDEIFGWLYDNFKFDILLLKYIPEYSTNFNSKELDLYSACPTIELSEYSNHDDFIKNKYSKNLKQNLRTAYNKAKKTDIEIETVVEEIDQNNFDDIIQISKFKLSDGKHSIYNDENKLLFMKKITKAMLSNIIFVKVNNKNVAYRANVFFNNNKFCIDASYDRNFRKFELGSISVDANIKDSYSKKISKQCLGPGLDLYKKKFTKKYTNIFIYPKKGNTLMSLLLIKPLKILTLRKEKEAKQALN